MIRRGAARGTGGQRASHMGKNGRMEATLLLVSMLLPWTGFIAGILIGRWWVVPLMVAAWIAVVLAIHDEGIDPSLLWFGIFMGGSAAVGVALRWLLFKPEAVAARARACGARLRGWMRAACWRG